MAVTMEDKTAINGGATSSGMKLPKIRVDQPAGPSSSSGAAVGSGLNLDNDLADRLSLAGGRFSRGKSNSKLLRASDESS